CSRNRLPDLLQLRTARPADGWVAAHAAFSDSAEHAMCLVPVASTSGAGEGMARSPKSIQHGRACHHALRAIPVDYKLLRTARGRWRRAAELAAADLSGCPDCGGNCPVYSGTMDRKSPLPFRLHTQFPDLYGPGEHPSLPSRWGDLEAT